MNPTMKAMCGHRRSPAGSFTSRFLCAVLVCLVMAGSAGLSTAQTTQPGSTAATAPEGALPADLEGIQGLRPGMSDEQMVEVGMSAVMAGRLEDGRRILLAVVKRTPKSLQALSDLGFVYERLAEEARANASDPARSEKADHFIDQAADVYSEAASIGLATGELSSAELLYNRILLHRPARSDALLGLARALSHSGRSIQAIGRYKDYISTLDGRNDPTAYLEMGKLYLESGYWRQALEALKRAQEMDPDAPEIDAALALTYQKGERMDEALEAARTATEKDPRNAEFRDVLARLELAQGDGEQSAIEARRAIEYTRSQLVDKPIDTSRLEALSRYYDTYEKALQMLLTEGKANPVVRVDLVRAIQEHAVVGRTLALTRALDVLTKASAAERGDPRLLEELASVQVALSLDKQAVSTCRRLLTVEPTNAAARRILEQIEAGGEPKAK